METCKGTETTSKLFVSVIEENILTVYFKDFNAGWMMENVSDFDETFCSFNSLFGVSVVKF